MALFGNTTKKTPRQSSGQAAKARKPIAETKKAIDGSLERVIRAPWLSEKALIGTEKGVYVFAVPREATKGEIKDAIELIYKVRPRKVTIVNLPAKKVSLRSRRGTGTRARRHKAYVHLKKGETISFA